LVFPNDLGQLSPCLLCFDFLLRVYMRATRHQKVTKCFFNPLSSSLSLSLTNTLRKTLQVILQLRARPISSSERKHMTIHSSRKNNYILLYVALLPLCKRTAYPRRKRTKVNPTPKIAFPCPPIQKPSTFWRAHQRAISIQNEPIIALKIQAALYFVVEYFLSILIHYCSAHGMVVFVRKLPFRVKIQLKKRAKNCRK
jgi:hypothetical protein